ncbi:hypothetical protein, partial [Pedobacter suwonensis]
EISDYTVDLKEIVSARNKVRKTLKKQLEPRKSVIEEVRDSKQEEYTIRPDRPDKKKSKLKRYLNE